MRAASVRIEKRDDREEKVVRYEGMASPRELLERIVIQCTETLRSLGNARKLEAEEVNGTAKGNPGKKKMLTPDSTVGDSETAALERFW